MVCAFCLHAKTHVYNSRPTKRINQVWRRRECLKCHKQFTTRESIDLGEVLRVEKRGQIQPFSSIRLLASLSKALDHMDNLDETTYWIANTVQQNLLSASADAQQTLATADIKTACTTVLRRFDYAAYVKYASTYGLGLKRR